MRDYRPNSDKRIGIEATPTVEAYQSDGYLWLCEQGNPGGWIAADFGTLRRVDQ